MENAAELRTPSAKANSRKDVIRKTERLWRSAGLDYDAIRAVSAEVRRRLQVERPKTRRTAPERLSRDEARRFIDAAYRASGVRGLLLKVLLQSGARVSEFIAFRVEDVHPEERTIQIVKGKGGKSRAVPVTEALAHELRTFIGDRRTGPLFVTRSRAAFGARRVQQIVAEVAEAAGITRPIGPHTLRHSIAQALLDSGMAIEELSQFLGHAQIATTQIYAASTPTAIRESFDRAMAARG